MITSILLVAWIAATADPKALVQSAVSNYRRATSQAKVEFLIHRPSWERSYELKMWTSGQDKVLILVEQPQRDKGVATLKVGNQLWTRTSRGGKVLRIPSALMEQPWMGSDFSNRDLSSIDDLIDKYTHKPGVAIEPGAVAVECIPLENSDVPWGKVVLDIKEDCVLRQRFYDQRGALVKELLASEMATFGARKFPTLWKMRSSSDSAKWTQLRYVGLKFDEPLSSKLFDVSSLESSR